MTGPNDSDGVTRPISVAELLARNGTIGAPPVGGRRRRRRGNNDAVTVAELTGEIPIIRPGATGEQPVVEVEDAPGDEAPAAEAPAAEAPADVAAEVEETTAPAAEEAEELEAEPEPEPEAEAEPEAAEPAADTDTDTDTDTDDEADTAVEAEIEETTDTDAVAVVAETNGHVSANGTVPVEAAPETDETPDAGAVATPFKPFTRPVRSDDPLPRRGRDAAPQRSHDPRPVRASAPPDAEAMSPDPLDDTVTDGAGALEDAGVGTETHDELGLGDISFEDDEDADALFGGDSLADERARGADLSTARADALDEADLSEAFDEPYEAPSRGRQVLHGLLIAAQSVLAVAFGAGLFLAFDQLWQWNSLVAMVLAILVTLGLVAGVWVVRKTEDIASTLIAVGVGLLVTFGPLALMHAA